LDMKELLISGLIPHRGEIELEATFEKRWLILVAFHIFSKFERKYECRPFSWFCNSTNFIQRTETGKEVIYCHLFFFFVDLTLQHIYGGSFPLVLLQYLCLNTVGKASVAQYSVCRIGQFLRLDDNGSWQQECFRFKDSVTHSHDEKKKNIKLWWKNEYSDEDYVQFVATVVKAQKMFWVKAVKSVPIPPCRYERNGIQNYSPDPVTPPPPVRPFVERIDVHGYEFGRELYLRVSGGELSVNGGSVSDSHGSQLLLTTSRQVKQFKMETFRMFDALDNSLQHNLLEYVPNDADRIPKPQKIQDFFRALATIPFTASPQQIAPAFIGRFTPPRQPQPILPASTADVVPATPRQTVSGFPPQLVPSIPATVTKPLPQILPQTVPMASPVPENFRFTVEQMRAPVIPQAIQPVHERQRLTQVIPVSNLATVQAPTISMTTQPRHQQQQPVQPDFRAPPQPSNIGKRMLLAEIAS
uniref:Reelin domain-containing protein n=1 Tax=Gongylonema pulchrum TaxID=637853 RepID=A0A183DZJ4_9BILA